MKTADTTQDPRAMAQTIARRSYGRLLASLAQRWGDLAKAEDALADAFERALSVWPVQGVPEKPEGWLLKTAHRRLIDESRKSHVQARAEPELVRIIETLADDHDPEGLPDERLGLMLACAHPDLDTALHTPLMLQAVLGLDAARIGAAFLVSPAAMGQRLSRGKARLRARGARFERPDSDALALRLTPVLAAVYAAYGAGWDELGAQNGPVKGLTEEALFLSRLLTELAPDIAEVWGLYGLIEHCEARTLARRDHDGGFIPLSEQDPTAWREDQIERAETALRHALTLGPAGRYTLEAAIQSVHAERRITGDTNWIAAAALYDALVEHNPSQGALTARACAHGEAFGADIALKILSTLAKHTEDYQPWWAAQAHWLDKAGFTQNAKAAYGRAIALSPNQATRDYLIGRRQSL